MKHMLMAVLAVALLGLGGCATKPMTPQEKEFQMAQNSCTAQTNAMIGGSRFGWDNQLQWSGYFEWCMESMGYTKADLRKIWY